MHAARLSRRHDLYCWSISNCSGLRRRSFVTPPKQETRSTQRSKVPEWRRNKNNEVEELRSVLQELSRPGGQKQEKEEDAPKLLDGEFDHGSGTQKKADEGSSYLSYYRVERPPPNSMFARGAPPISPNQVVMVYRASKTLTDDDFRRLCPQNVHELPNGATGEYVRIIPGRNSTTLERNGSYYVIFPNARSASVWRANAKHMHEVARAHSFKSYTTDDVVPPPGFRVHGEDVSALTSSYTLGPPAGPFNTVDANEFSSFKMSLFRRGGYPGVVDSRGWVLPRVMLRVTGVSITLADLRAAFVWDSWSRHLPANLVSVKLINQAEKAGENEKDAVNETDDQDILAENELQDFKDIAGDESDYGGRWLLTFKNKNRARHFARTWHRRPFPFPKPDSILKNYEMSEGLERALSQGRENETMVYTEVLW